MIDRIAVLMILAAVIAGCGLCPDRVVVKPQVVNVPTYIRAPIPADLTKPCTLAEPDPACLRAGKREFCNGQLATMRADYHDALAKCDADKTALRALGKSKP